MSHFAVLVVTPNGTSEEIQKALQPYHEFECTGINDQYVQDVDETESVREDYSKLTYRKLKAIDGTLHCPSDDRFYREPTPEEIEKHGLREPFGIGNGLTYKSQDWGDGLGYRPKVRFVPEGYSEVEVPRSETETFAEYVESYHGSKLVPEGEHPSLEGEHKFGYALIENGEVVKVVNRTNPNREWDWWRIGGRYSGRLVTKSGAIVDSAKKSAVDTEGMRQKNLRERKDYVAKGLGETDGLTFEQVCEIHKKAHADYVVGVAKWEADGRPGNLWGHLNSIESIKQAHESKVWGNGLCGGIVGSWVGFEEPDIEQWVNSAPALTAFAFLDSTGWHESGSMGWWGIVSDKKEDWKQTISGLIDSIPDDHHITFVDCHI